MKNKLYLLYSFTLLLLAFTFGCHNDVPKKVELYAFSTSWYEDSVQVNYQNGSIDTIIIDVYERADNMKVENGNLSYWKATKETGGTVAYVVKLSSYVRSFKILNSELKSKTN